MGDREREFLQPQIIHLSRNRCYRLNPLHERFQSLQPQPQSSAGASLGSGYEADDLYDDDDGFEVEEIENSKYKITFQVPQALLGRVVGQRGVTKKRIESETRTQIRVPQQHTQGDIEIIGKTPKDVCAARRRIDAIILGARGKLSFTHFTCIPMNKPVIKESFNAFKSAVLAEDNTNLNELLFQNPDKLHLTFGMSILLDENERLSAAETLQQCKYEIEELIKREGWSRPLQINLRGLDIMNDDPSYVNVLYAKVESEPIQRIANAVVAKFAERGLSQSRNQNENVKLHVTMMNSRFLDPQSSSNQHQRFDVRRILETYSNYDFGTIDLTEIHLSQRHTKAADGFYEATSVIKI